MKPICGVPIAAYARTWIDAFPNLYFEVTQLIPTEGEVAVQWRMFGTNTGKRGNKPATGAKIALGGVSIITIRNRRIFSLVSYFDQKFYLEQLGYNVAAYRL